MSNLNSLNLNLNREEIEAEIAKTQDRLLQLQSQLQLIQQPSSSEKFSTTTTQLTPLSLNDYLRYGRQMILPQFGLSGQLKLKQASVLVIGAGGLGCPALLYLARAGVGRISIVDHDTVEVSNLHRQVLHTNSTVGINKAESAKLQLLSGTTGLTIDTYPIAFTSHTLASSVFPSLQQFSLVLDCTDNAQTRYLISDACAASGTTLVSGAAIRTDGQLSIWNLPLSDGRGPCYRCIFPEPIEERLEQRCEDEGVLGPIVGLVGVLMALEALQLLTHTHDCVPKLLLVPSFRTIKLRKAQPDCEGCKPEARARFAERLCQSLLSGDGLSSDQVCGRPPALSPGTIPLFQRITTEDLTSGAYKLDQFEIIDVRPVNEFTICSLPNSINRPINELLKSNLDQGSHQSPTLFVCRRGNDSQLAAQALAANQTTDGGGGKVFDLKGGLVAYAQQVDPTFPIY